MSDLMTFPDTVDEFMEQYKIVDTEHVYTNGAELVPIFRMKQWFEHSAQPERTGMWINDVAYFDEDGCPCMVTRCNQCGEAYPVSNYCPNCGARMGGDTDEAD